MSLGAGEYLGGAVAFAFIWGAAACVAWLLVRYRLPHLRGAIACVAGGLLTLLGVFSCNIVPAALGLLSVASVLVASGIWLALGVALTRIAPDADAEAWPPGHDQSTASRALAIVGVGVVVVSALAVTIGVARLPPTNVDTLTFHLPGIARWIQSGSIWQIDQFIPLVATGHYPSTGNVIELSVVLPWRSDFAFRLLGLPMLALAGLALYSLGRELGCDRPSAALIAAATISVPSILGPALVQPLPDVILVAGFSAGVAFLVRHHRTWRLSDLVLAGVGLGIAFGTKWYGVTSVPILIAVWGLGWLIARRGIRSVAAATAILAATVLGLGGIWLLRNWIESSNPFFPAQFELGPFAFDAPPDPRGQSIEATVLDFAGDGRALTDALLPGWLTSLGVAGFALALAVPLCAALLAREWSMPMLRERRWLGVSLVASAVALAFAYAATPSSAPGFGDDLPDVTFNARYAVPALVLASGCAGWIAARAGAAGRMALQLVALVAIVDGIARELRPGAASIAASVLLVAGGVGAWALWRQAGWRLRAPSAGSGRFSRGAVVAAFATVGSLALLAGGYALQRDFNERGYGGLETTDWVLENAPEDANIGIAAAWGDETRSPVRAMFGPRLRNEVSYVGEERQNQLAAFPDRKSFQAALRAQRYDLLLVGRGFAQVKLHPERARWAAELGFVEVARDPGLVLLVAPWSDAGA